MFGKRLRALREAAGYSQIALARELGHGGNSKLSQWEAGKNEPSMHDIGRICQLTKGSVEWLYFGVTDLMPNGILTRALAILEADQ